jgi:hypothetical protein
MSSEAYLSTNKYCPLFDRPQRGAARHLLHHALILNLHSYHSATYKTENVRGGKPNREIRRGSRMAVQFIVVKPSCITRDMTPNRCFSVNGHRQHRPELIQEGGLSRDPSPAMRRQALFLCSPRRGRASIYDQSDDEKRRSYVIPAEVIRDRTTQEGKLLRTQRRRRRVSVYLRLLRERAHTQILL